MGQHVDRVLLAYDKQQEYVCRYPEATVGRLRVGVGACVKFCNAERLQQSLGDVMVPARMCFGTV